MEKSAIKCKTIFLSIDRLSFSQKKYSLTPC